MSHCPPRCCAGCRNDACQERLTYKAQLRRKETLSSGPVPELHHDTEDAEDSNDKEECIDQGDQILASGPLPPRPSEDICASSTISTCLAEAFKANSEATAPSVPDYLKEFSDVFSKKSFDTLPETSNGTTLLNWFPEKNPPVVKSIHWPLLNKRNWTHSLRKIWRQVGSVRPNPLCHLRFSLLKRRTVLSAWFKTIELLMLSQ